MNFLDYFCYFSWRGECTGSEISLLRPLGILPFFISDILIFPSLTRLLVGLVGNIISNDELSLLTSFGEIGDLIFSIFLL